MKTIHRFPWTLAVVAFALGMLLPAIARAGDESESLYMAKCKACHGPGGDGDTPMGKKLNVKSLKSPDTQKLSDEELAKVIAKGRNKMPTFEKQLPPEKIKLVIAFVRTLAAKG